MKIQTGRGTIPLIILIGIWSISALTSLPGLAVSPILGDLKTIFPDSSELDIQMLTSLPSLLIIPFILLSGKLTEKINYILILQIGLAIFALSGVLYLLSNKMWQLIAVSGILGVGAGIIVPLSTGLISKFFYGPYRVKQFGLSSAITNVTLVIATSITGVLAESHWHLPFIVYLLPIASIFLSFSLYKNMKRSQAAAKANPTVDNNSNATPDATIPPDVLKSKYGINVKHLLSIMGLYGMITYISIIVSFNLPFLMQEYHLDSGKSGLMISLFFLAVMAPGFFLNYIIKYTKCNTILINLILVAIGLAVVWIFRSEWLIAIGCIFMGFGYGVIQPLLYEKTTTTALPKKATLALGFMMVMNYLAILLCPFIIDLFQIIFHTTSQHFPFIFNLCLTIILIVIAVIRRKSFLFGKV